MPNQIKTHRCVVSSQTLQRIVGFITSHPDIKLPTVPKNTLYNRMLPHLYRKQDINTVSRFINSMRLSGKQTSAVDSICRWKFYSKNTTEDTRKALGLIGCVIGWRVIISTGQRDSVEQYRPRGDVMESLLTSPHSFIFLVLRDCIKVEKIDAWIPIADYSPEYDALSRLREYDELYGLDVEKAELVEWVKATTAGVDIASVSESRKEYAARRMIQALRYISSFPENKNSVIPLAQIRKCCHTLSANCAEVAQTAEMVQLADDVFGAYIELHDALTETSAKAKELLLQMQAGELLYEDAIALCRQQRHIISVQLIVAMTMLAYMFSVSMYNLSKREEFLKSFKELDQCLGITRTYVGLYEDQK